MQYSLENKTQDDPALDLTFRHLLPMCPPLPIDSDSFRIRIQIQTLLFRTMITQTIRFHTISSFTDFYILSKGVVMRVEVF